MVLYGPEWSPMLLYGPLWSRLVLYHPVWSLRVPYGHVRSHRIPNGPVWSFLALFGLVWLCMVLHDHVWPCRSWPYGPFCICLVLYGSVLSRSVWHSGMVPYGATWFRMFNGERHGLVWSWLILCAPVWSIIVLYGSVWSNMFHCRFHKIKIKKVINTFI